MDTQFIWHDGGRAAAGYVGHTGDCAIRAISIATGHSYRDVYVAIFDLSGQSPRQGVKPSLIDRYLQNLGFQHLTFHSSDIDQFSRAISSVAVVNFSPIQGKPNGHVCAVVNNTVYDTWNAFNDYRFKVDSYWVAPKSFSSASGKVIPAIRKISKRQQINNDAMLKAIDRIKKMRNTAANAAATQGEIENAMRMASTMMLQFQLSEEDLRIEDAAESSGYGSLAVYVTGTRAVAWEKGLAQYVCELLGDAFSYFTTHGPRTRIVFYGRIDSVESAVALFTELLLEIAALGRLKYGGYARGSGASYCEGFVRGLSEIQSTQSLQQKPALIETTQKLSTRLKREAKIWLRDECGILLSLSSGSGRSSHDPNAAQAGVVDGRSRTVTKPGQPRIQ